jgi:hypothetical protein
MQRTIGRPSFRLNLCLEYLDELHPLIKTLEKNNSRRFQSVLINLKAFCQRNQRGRGRGRLTLTVGKLFCRGGKLAYLSDMIKVFLMNNFWHDHSFLTIFDSNSKVQFVYPYEVSKLFIYKTQIC